MASDRNPVTAYAEDVLAGKILAGPHVRNECTRHLSDLKKQKEKQLFFDDADSTRVIEFFENFLCLNGGQFEGLPFILLPWQRFIVGSLFGWKNTADGFLHGTEKYPRRYRMAFIETGKGTGKSPLAAGVGLFMLTSDEEPRAEVYAAAVKKDQAKVLFRDAVAMVELSPTLDSSLFMSGGAEKNNIAYLKHGSFFRPISSEDRGRGQSGPRPHCGLLDEIHEHPTNIMVEMMRAGTKWRQQAMIFMITNSGSDRETVCYDYHDYASKVSSGAIKDESFFSYVCALDEEEDPFLDEECWEKVNPSLGVTTTMKYLREQVQQARGMPSKENFVRRLNFCQWTDSDSVWVARETWMRAEHVLDLDKLVGRRAFGGLDLSGRKDLTSFALAFEPDAEGVIDLFVEFWTPKDTLLDRASSDRVPYDVWEKEGWLHAQPGKSIDYSFVAKRIAELHSKYDIEEIAYDRYRIEDILREFDASGLEAFCEDDDKFGSGIRMIPHGQGFVDMGKAVEVFEEYLLNDRLRVHTNPVLRWNVSSVVLDTDAAGNRKFTKRKSTGRIDGVVAAAMAIRRASNLAAGTNSGPSVYETENFFV